MKKKFSILLAICMLSIFALTACADDVTDEDGLDTGASPTTSTAPGNGSNGDEDITTGVPGTTGGTGTNGGTTTDGGAVTGENGQNGLGNGNANGVNGNLTVTPKP